MVYDARKLGHMKHLWLIILFMWTLLIENGTNWIGAIVSFGGEFEIQFSLILKLILLIANIRLLVNSKQKTKEIQFLLGFMFFLLISTLFAGLIYNQYFAQAISVNLHILLVLNIAIYIYWSATKEQEIQNFYNWLRFFGLFNATLVIISFISPSLSTFFEAGTSNSGTTRAFGIMGDEVSIFLTFFFFDSLIFKQKLKAWIYTVAILCTGSIGAFFTFSALLLYYLIYNKNLSKSNLLTYSLSTLLLLFLFIIFSDSLQNISTINRISANLYNPENETANLRLLSWTTAFEMVKENYILGTGFGAYGSVVLEKFNYLTINNEVAINILTSTYNPYLQIACEAGLIGLVFFINFLRKSLKLSKPHNYNKSFISNFKTTSHGWLLIFFLTCLSANWFLPASFLLILTIIVIGLNLKLNDLLKNG